MRALWVVAVVVGCSSAPPPPPALTSHAPPPAPSTTAMLALGGKHSCVLEREVVSCWGNNDAGQLGNGTRDESARPVRVTGLRHPIAITAGELHTCALERDGHVQCWGALDEVLRTMHPVEVGRVATAVEIQAGSSHTCARLDSGDVACWGGDLYGELGGADRKTALVPGVHDAVALRVGFTTSCAIGKTGAVTCWGGHWLTGMFASERKHLPPTEIPELRGVTELAVGATHACGIRDGEVICYGEASKLGDPAAKCCKPAIGKPGIRDATAIAAGFAQTCVRRATGDVACWSPSDRLEPMRPAPMLADVEQLAAGPSHACARKRSGQVWCWGDDGSGQLGRGISGRVTKPTRVARLDQIQQLALGYIHSCALRSDGLVMCWPDREDTRGPVEMTPLHAASAVLSGIYETCAVPSLVTGAPISNTISCVQREQRQYPAATVKATTAATIAWDVAGAGICALQAKSPVARTGDLACVEEIMDAHSIAVGSLPNRTLTPIAGFAGARIFDGGEDEICAVIGSDLVCTDHTDARMRDRNASPWSPPRKITGLDPTKLQRIVGGGAHFCALDNQAAVWCWGRNTKGQLGIGASDRGGVDTARRIESLGGVIQLALGHEHTCALLRDGTVWCWGSDEHGQLGDDDRAFTPRFEPARVPNLSGVVVEIAAGAEHTCARTADAVYCWGSNEHGRLGIGVAPASKSPVQVLR
ncbi:MAG TPA: hypothetical protein VFQ53_07595 [Kofleriaceae bacterium]|nr:hypothetical protein [Kofleriaceae bacterium]